MTKTDALLCVKDPIRVYSTHPGFIWRPVARGYLQAFVQGPEGRMGPDELQPLGHVGEPDDIAWGSVYLAADDAWFVTGDELVINGGTWRDEPNCSAPRSLRHRARLLLMHKAAGDLDDGQDGRGHVSVSFL
jgi:hypothetical protein